MRNYCHIFAMKPATTLKQSVWGTVASAPESAINTGGYATYSG